MSNELLIRQAAIEDLPKIVPLFDSYREYFHQPKNPVKAEQFLFDRFQNLQSVIFIAEQEDKVIGFAQLFPIFSSLSLQRVWLLNDFYIAEGYRNKGIGKQLFAKVKEFALLTKSKGIELSVEHTNERAWHFWEKQGFKMDKKFRYYSYLL
ncbi:GNAT family N-acetyltransferase [Bacillus litorisediminis]|uniref:GNAT family N-acetyltransferase n=1 Tax=Bacillus litorisediminis TaxID=2922713 RepID=UPI001FABB454|nr:GNAT family N-acetyltransferase [Bacillus litorisediminis]